VVSVATSEAIRGVRPFAVIPAHLLRLDVRALATLSATWHAASLAIPTSDARFDVASVRGCLLPSGFAFL
jgi:hypothetical protein